MTRTYSRRFTVRQYELDSFGHVNTAIYVNYLQEAAIEASADAGYGLDWYDEHSTRWVIRRLTARYFAPATYGEELEVTTWVSDIGRVRSNREYEVRRVSDGAQLVRARADWVYVNVETEKPARVPEGATQRFQPSGDVPSLGARLRNPEHIDDCYRYRSYRKVQTYELDVASHVNHANYLRWVEQAYFDATESVGLSLTRALEKGVIVLQAGHDIEFFKPAQEGDTIEIVSWVTEMARLRGAWTHEILNARTGELLARDYSLGVFLNADLKPTPLPRSFFEQVLAGPSHPVDKN